MPEQQTILWLVHDPILRSLLQIPQNMRLFMERRKTKLLIGNIVNVNRLGNQVLLSFDCCINHEYYFSLMIQ